MRINSQIFVGWIALHILLACMLLLVLLVPAAHGQPRILRAQSAHATLPGPLGQAFEQAAREFGVPSTLLKAICYMEGRLSDQNGQPSVDHGFGCMHLMKNRRGDMLDQAARELKLSVDQLKFDLPDNVRGGAAILRDDALQLSSARSLPNNLNDWYGAVAAYSDSTTRSTALMYANDVYKILRRGFSAPSDSGEMITLAPQAVHPNMVSAASVRGTGDLPAECAPDNNVDYSGAVDCILPPQNYDCNVTPKNAPCTYESAQRPNDYAIDQIAIHDIEGTALSALNVFQDSNSGASIQYVIDSDGTIYQTLRESDIGYHVGNYWYNQHSIGIEHAGYDATGYRWYNATEYLASAKLVAYLLQKYHLPLDRAHVVAHGTVPSPSSTITPNHVDPGPYWLWDYYFGLIHQQGVPLPATGTTAQMVMLQPQSDQSPAGSQGHETQANFAFFYLYKGPSTRSGRIIQQGRSSDITDVTNSVEPGNSYYYVAKALDSAGSGDMMYQIWYGEETQAHASSSNLFAHAALAWLAVPPGAAVQGPGTLVRLTTSDGSKPQIYGRPTSNTSNTPTLIGDAPIGALFASCYTVTEDGTSNLWYEIDYNHRQAWVPASEVTSSSANQPVQPDPKQPTQPVQPNPNQPVPPSPNQPTQPVPPTPDQPVPPNPYQTPDSGRGIVKPLHHQHRSKHVDGAGQ